MTILESESGSSTIESSLKEKSRLTRRIKKISKLDFLVNLYQGKAGKDGDEIPSVPITNIKELALRLKEAEDKGYFRVRTDTKTERNADKYESETKWYLTQAAKKNIIDREYKERKKPVVQ